MQRVKHFHRYAGRLLIAGIFLGALSNAIADEMSSPESSQIVVLPFVLVLVVIMSILCWALGISGYIIRLWRENKSGEEEVSDQLDGCRRDNERESG